MARRSKADQSDAILPPRPAEEVEASTEAEEEEAEEEASAASEVDVTTTLHQNHSNRSKPLIFKANSPNSTFN